MFKIDPIGMSVVFNMVEAPFDIFRGEKPAQHCWELSFAQRLRVLVTGKVFLFVTFKGLNEMEKRDEDTD